jgi:hypothetical protein
MKCQWFAQQGSHWSGSREVPAISVRVRIPSILKDIKRQRGVLLIPKHNFADLEI